MRPLKVTPEMKEELMKKFAQHLQSLTMTTNTFSFSHSVADVKNKDKVFITFSMKAYIKMRDLVDRFSSEVGWFGFIDKISDLEYHITDICVYPQLVTGATVKETNDPWDDDMPIEQIKRRHFHGHSHVNMAPSPSGTDIKHRNDQVALVKSDSFYFFMITNKSCAWTATLFDLANNVVYDTDDILLDVDLGNGEMLSDFVEDTKKMVKTSTPAALKKMMDERNGVDKKNAPAVMTTSNCYNGQYTWLPKPSELPPVDLKKKEDQKSNKKYTGPVIHSQTDLFGTMTEEQWEAYAAKYPDYYDDVLGYVSDSPMAVNDVILGSMR